VPRQSEVLTTDEIDLSLTRMGVRRGDVQEYATIFEKESTENAPAFRTGQPIQSVFRKVIYKIKTICSL